VCVSRSGYTLEPPPPSEEEEEDDAEVPEEGALVALVARRS
jgi:hypothetical protein